MFWFDRGTGFLFAHATETFQVWSPSRKFVRWSYYFWIHNWQLKMIKARVRVASRGSQLPLAARVEWFVSGWGFWRFGLHTKFLLRTTSTVTETLLKQADWYARPSVGTGGLFPVSLSLAWSRAGFVIPMYNSVSQFVTIYDTTMCSSSSHFELTHWWISLSSANSPARQYQPKHHKSRQ